MHLVLKTNINCGIPFADGLAACAIVRVDAETLTYWTALMAEAAMCSTRISKPVTLQLDDWSAAWYMCLPDAMVEGDLDRGWFFLEDDDTPGVETDSDLALDLAYAELRVSQSELSWYCGPRDGEVEEYTLALTRKDLEEILAALTAIDAEH